MWNCFESLSTQSYPIRMSTVQLLGLSMPSQGVVTTCSYSLTIGAEIFARRLIS